MSERGVQQKSLAATLEDYSGFATALPVIINLPPESWRNCLAAVLLAFAT